jgi:hypothetical protein
MATENTKTWIKQGTVDATFPPEQGLVLPKKTHSYCTTDNIIDNSGIFAIVQTKNGQPWDGVSNNNIASVYVYTSKDTGKMTRTITWSDGHQTIENRELADYQGMLAFGMSNPITVTLDIPSFQNLQDAENYIKNGDWSNALNADALQTAKTITRVYVDNSTPPNLKIVFDIDEPEDSDKHPPSMIWLRLWKTTDYGDFQGATMFKQQGFQFGGNVSYTWGALELMGGGKDLAIETSTHADNSDNVIAYVADNGTCQPLDTPITNAKNSIVCIRGNGDGDDGYKKPTEDSDGADENASANVSNVLTTTYKLSKAQLQSLGNFLWQDSFITNIKLLNNSPIENIVSVKALPVSLSVGNEQSLVLGNVDTGIMATPVTNTYIKFTMGTQRVPHFENNFSDYNNVTCDIYLPCIGTIADIDPREVIGQTLTLKYCFDVMTGDVLAELFNNKDGCANLMGIYKGNIGIDIPLTASNRAQVEAGYISDFIGAVGSVATKSITGVAEAGLSAITRQITTKSSGSVSGCTAQGLPIKPYLHISSPVVPDYSDTFVHTYGRPCLLSKKLSKLKGFTQVDKNCDLSGIPCTHKEKEILRNIISSGFYL